MKNAVPVTVICCLLLATGVVFAQEGRGPDRLPTIEELYLTNPRLMAVREQALAVDREVKLQALGDIESWMDEGTYKAEEETVQAILVGLAHEGTAYRVSEGRRLVNYYPMVRRKAAELLGRLGGETADEQVRERAKYSLIDIVIFDGEVMVKAEAAYALGVIGNNENGHVVEVLSESIRKQTTIAPDNNYAYAVILAIDKLAERNEGIRDFRAYTTLVTIMQGNYTRRVKDKAFEVMQKIRGY